MISVLVIVMAFFALPVEAAEEVPEAARLVVSIHETPAGSYITDTAGLTLYIYDRDRTPGKSECYDECVVNWVPVATKGDPSEIDDADWSVIHREDDTLQLAWRGKPLYRSVKDTHPGSVLGADPNGVWIPAYRPVNLPAGFTLQQTLAGRVLADADGFTLYWNEAQTSVAQKPALDSEVSQWTAFRAPLVASATAPWSIVEGSAGTKQWAYSGKPLYRFVNDKNPKEIKGHGVAAWAAAALEAPTLAPDWVSVQVIDTGRALANSQGFTLYAATNMEQIKREKTCLEDCMTTYMGPVLAAEDEKPVGNWSITRNENQDLQWAFNGALVFTHTRDRKPGDFMGASFAVGQGIRGGFHPITEAALLRPQ